MKASVAQGLLAVDWLDKTFSKKTTEPTDQLLTKWSKNVAAAMCASHIRENRPNAFTQGFSFQMDMQHVYTIVPGAWMNDDVLRATGEVIDRRTAGRCVTMLLPGHSTRKNEPVILPDDLLEFVKDSLRNKTVAKIFLPVNVDGSDWAVICVDKFAPKVSLYDSFEKPKVMALLREIGTDLCSAAGVMYPLMEINSPVQKDFYSCGCSFAITAGVWPTSISQVLTTPAP